MPNRRIKKRVSPIDLDQKFYDKDLSFLKTFLTEQGRITPRYITKLTVKQQNRLAKAVKRARVQNLLPFVLRDNNEIS
jgi:small subunit ribosomal protein S18|uniref:Small ribosomal subunit protein bS18c n=1 Tax=Octactis speculum TaxID=3111310 RepID=A0A514CPQ7_9STRA|nr:ribosomal protein S18 [Dictyocha speculum]QDH81780.1 ribosomal protein S18 [Dictyocha speculum]